MRLRILVAVGAVAAATGAWTIMASRLFVWMGGLSAAFPSPWVTWWHYARQPHINGSTLFYLIGSGLLSALPILLTTVVVVAIIGAVRAKRSAIYGSQKWADGAAMERGGFTTGERPL